MLLAAALASLLLGDGAAAAAAPRSAALAASNVVDLCPSFSTSSGARGDAATTRLAALGARLPTHKHVHAIRPADGDRSSVTWRGCGASASPAIVADDDGDEDEDDGDGSLGWRELNVPPSSAPPAPVAWPWDSLGGSSSGGGGIELPLSYQGGDVLTGVSSPLATPVHLIWYGNWSGNPATTLLPLAVSGASDSPWLRINADYYRNAGSMPPARLYVTPKLLLAKQAFLPGYKYGTSVSDEDLNAMLGDALVGGLPLSDDAIYVLLTSADVVLTSGCAWSGLAAQTFTC